MPGLRSLVRIRSGTGSEPGDRVCVSIDNKKLGSNHREGAMRLGIVCDLITHAWFEYKLPAVLELGLQLTLKAQNNMSFHASVISQVSRRILDEADANASKVLGAPEGDACLTFMLNHLYFRPVGYSKGNACHLHDDFSLFLTI